MKLTQLTYLALSLCLAHRASAVLLFDDFDDGSLNPGLWTVHHPFADSSATEAGGVLAFRNRGGLITQQDFPTAIDISGRVQFSGNVHDMFTFVTRTTGDFHYPYGTFDNGIRFNWLKMSDSGQILNIVSIDRIVGGNPGNDVNLALGTFDFSYGQWYDFRIMDDGNNISLYFDDLNTPLLTASDASHPGAKIGFYNREGAAAGSSISNGSEVQMDRISVSSVPDRSDTFSLLLIALLLAMTGIFRVQAHTQ